MLCFLELLAFNISKFNTPHLLILGFFLSFFLSLFFFFLQRGFKSPEVTIWCLMVGLHMIPAASTLPSSQEKPSGCKGQILALLHCKPLWPRAIYMWSFFYQPLYVKQVP